MAHVLPVAAFEFGNPMVLVILMKARDSLLHRRIVAPGRGFVEAPARPPKRRIFAEEIRCF